MDSLADEVLQRLEHLEQLRGRFVIRAATLPADLVLAGLYDELRDAALLAVELCRQRLHLAAFPMARMVFESTQRLIALATDDDYLRVGVRAWLYYLRKDKRIAHLARGTGTAQDWYTRSINQMQHIWCAHNQDAVALLHEETARLDAFQKARTPDNFMGADLGDIVDQRHAKMASASGKPVQQLKELDRGIYAGLSRESHSRTRLDPAALRISADGTVTVIPQKVDHAMKEKLVLGCISSSLAETDAALAYLLDSRQKARAKELERRAADVAQETLPPNFKPDLGLHLMKHGGTSTTFHFPGVPITKFGILTDGTVSWSSNVALTEQEIFIATFDVPRTLAADLASALGVDGAFLSPSTQLGKQSLASSVLLTLDCTLGEIRESAGGTFAPLCVIKIAQSPSKS